MTRFCYGVFAKLLLWGIDKPKFQTKLHIMLLSILEESYVEMKVDPAHASRWVNCRDDVTSALRETAIKIKPEHVSKHFKEILQTLVNPNRQDLMIVAIRNIIAEDMNIIEGIVIDQINNVRKVDLQENITLVDVADFLAGAFLYAVIHADNKEGRIFSAQINEFMNKLPEKLELSKNKKILESIDILTSNEIDASINNKDLFLESDIEVAVIETVEFPNLQQLNDIEIIETYVYEDMHVNPSTDSTETTPRRTILAVAVVVFTLVLSGALLWFLFPSNDFDNNIIMIASGSEHSLALREDGTLWAWGVNNLGQLGNGTFNNSEYPVYVMSDVKHVSAGAYFSLAITNDGVLWAWGHNFWGQLGDNTRITRNIPVEIARNVNYVSTGFAHSLALKSTGELYGWGYNATGQLGLGEARDYVVYKPTMIMLDDIRYISAGQEHSLAITHTGRLYAWGCNSTGQLGLGYATQIPQFTPIPVPSMDSVQHVSGGAFHTLAITVDGRLFAWGENSRGQLGNNSRAPLHHPTPIHEDYRFSYISAGGYHSLAICIDETLFAWGSNHAGQVAPQYQPRDIMEPFNHNELNGVSRIAAGMDNGQSLIVVGHGDLWEWGGRNTENSQLVPLDEAPPTPRELRPLPSQDVRVVAGGRHSLALREDGTLWAWGQNDRGILGNGTVVHSSEPIRIMDSVIYVTAGHYHSLAIKNDSTLWAWGANIEGQLGDGTRLDRSIPVKVGIDEQIISVAVGSRHTIALDAHGNVWAWGDNRDGALGLGDEIIESLTPVLVQIDEQINRIATHANHSMAIDIHGNLWVWGDWNQTQFYLPTSIDFVRETMGEIKYISTNRNHTMFIGQDGSLWGIGENILEYLGDRVTTYENGLMQIGEERQRWLEVSAGRNHTIAREYNPVGENRTWIWGNNDLGQLGTSDTVGLNNVPSTISISAGNGHTLIVDSQGDIWAWGSNNRGQLGHGNSIINNTPRGVYTVLEHQILSSPQGGPGVHDGINYQFIAQIESINVSFGIDRYNTLWSWVNEGTVDDVWGNNDIAKFPNAFGQMGNGTRGRRLSNSSSRVQIIDSVRYVFPGNHHILVISTDGRLYAWGRNDWGQLGDGNIYWHTKPVPVETEPGVLFQTARAGNEGNFESLSYSFAIDIDGNHWLWGNHSLLVDNTPFLNNSVQVIFPPCNNATNLTEERTSTI